MRLCKLQQLMHTRTNQEDDACNGEHLLVYRVPRSVNAKQTIIGLSLYYQKWWVRFTMQFSTNAAPSTYTILKSVILKTIVYPK